MLRPHHPASAEWGHLESVNYGRGLEPQLGEVEAEWAIPGAKENPKLPTLAALPGQAERKVLRADSQKVPDLRHGGVAGIPLTARGSQGTAEKVPVQKPPTP